VYDLHYFLTSLLDLYISQELFDWIISLYPEELIPEETPSTLTKSASDKESDESSSNEASDTSDPSESNDTTSDTANDTASDTASEQSNTVSESSDSASESSDTASDTGSASSSESRTSSEDDESNKLSDFEDTDTLYLHEGRMINGIEEMFPNLPQPLGLLGNKFFDTFTTKPADFDENTAIYFKAGF
jgi:hypothetical protein